MSTWQVTERATGTVVDAYGADAPDHSDVYPFDTYNHTLVIPVEQPGPSAESIAAAVLAALQGTTIPANIKQVNDVTVQGAGTKLNPWQPV